ncbi:MAG: hypothetical protein ACAH95_09980 [Fimbriimonas sp.]
MRQEAAWWRIGGFVATLIIVGVCLSLLATSVRDLAQAGPPQDLFVSELQQGLNKDFVPRLQQVASRTITEMQPVVQAEFQQLNTRVPELTEASLKEVETLQKNIPDRSEKVLDETFGAALKAQEPKIREMFPSVKEEQVTALLTSLGTIATTRGSRLSEELLRPHTNRMHSIVTGLHKIAATEPAAPAGEVADWHMGLLVLDLLREDLKDLAPKAPAKPADKNKETKK